jgi:hypothetical protein
MLIRSLAGSQRDVDWGNGTSVQACYCVSSTGTGEVEDAAGAGSTTS